MIYTNYDPIMCKNAYLKLYNCLNKWINLVLRHRHGLTDTQEQKNRTYTAESKRKPKKMVKREFWLPYRH